MLCFSFALALCHPQLKTESHPAVQNMGKLGIWYWRSPGAKAPLDDEDGVPPLEKVDDPYLEPGLTRKQNIRTTAFLTRFKSVQVNVDSQGQNIVGDAANEPSFAINPLDPFQMVAGWRQFDNVTSNFRQAGNGYTLDGGANWRNHTVFTPGTFRSDPVINTDASGNFHYNSLQQTFFTDIFSSSNAGIDWVLKGPATGGDKQWMACDNTSGPGRGFLYQSWSTAGNNYNGRQFSRSINGGTTWMNPINIPGSPIWGTLDVARNGNLYLCGLANSSFSFIRSSDAQNAATTPTFDRVVTVSLGGAIVTNSTLNPAGLLGQAWIATDKSTGPNAGNIYMLCSVGVNTANPCQVNFVRSTDNGLTWSAPKTINSDPLGQGVTHWFGTMSVAPNGRIDVCWYDNRANPAVSNSAMFYSSSYDGGITWTPNVQLTPYFNPNVGYPNQNKMGDYIGMISDNRTANIVYAATFNGEQDIWYLRVPMVTGQPSPATTISTVQGSFVSGVLSDVWNLDGNQYLVNSVPIAGPNNVAEVQTEYTLPFATVGSLGFNLGATVSATTSGAVLLWNWNTQTYDLQKSAIWRGGYAKTEMFKFNSAVSPYVDANRKVRCLIRFNNPEPSLVQPFSVSFDLLQLTFG